MTLSEMTGERRTDSLYPDSQGRTQDSTTMLQSPRLVKDDTFPHSSNPEPKKKGFFTERESKLVGDRQVRKAR